MENITFNDKNPWLDNESSFGNLSSVLAAARKTGHFSDRARVVGDIEEENGSGERPQSIVMIDILKQMDQTRREIHQLNEEIQQIQLEKETTDLTDMEALEKYSAELNELSSHMDQVATDKESFLRLLQQPHVTNSIQMHANYKKYACEMFPLLTPILSDVGQLLEVIEWSNQLEPNDQRMESTLSDISNAMDKLQTSFQCLCSVKGSVRNLHSSTTR